MGSLVRAELGDDYRVAALVFGEGTFLAMQPVGGPRISGTHVVRIHAPSRPTLEQRLLSRGDTDFVFAPKDECGELGDACRAMRMFGIAYPIGFHELSTDFIGIDVARAFDRVVFFPQAFADR